MIFPSALYPQGLVKLAPNLGFPISFPIPHPLSSTSVTITGNGQSLKDPIVKKREMKSSRACIEQEKA